ncbi:MAG TPA: hypothetical protein VE222_00665 [Nitrospiraceae bacterium]|nr:hypothetical protein [Nitrospiraceae bacterium]
MGSLLATVEVCASHAILSQHTIHRHLRRSRREKLRNVFQFTNGFGYAGAEADYLKDIECGTSG